MQIITNVVPFDIAPPPDPIKRKAQTPAAKRARSFNVSASSAPYVSGRKTKPFVVVKEPHSFSSLYLDPINTSNVKTDVDTSAKSSMDPNVVSNIENIERYASEAISLGNPRTNKSLNQTSMNATDKDYVDKSIYVLLSNILDITTESNVVSNVTTSLAQPDYPAETTQDNAHGVFDKETDSIETLTKPQEDEIEVDPVNAQKEKSNDSVFVEEEKSPSDKECKEENTGVNIAQFIDVVNMEELDSDDELIGKRLAPGILKFLKNMKGKDLCLKGKF